MRLSFASGTLALLAALGSAALHPRAPGLITARDDNISPTSIMDPAMTNTSDSTPPTSTPDAQGTDCVSGSDKWTCSFGASCGTSAKSCLIGSEGQFGDCHSDGHSWGCPPGYGCAPEFLGCVQGKAEASSSSVDSTISAGSTSSANSASSASPSTTAPSATSSSASTPTKNAAAGKTLDIGETSKMVGLVLMGLMWF